MASSVFTKGERAWREWGNRLEKAKQPPVLYQTLPTCAKPTPYQTICSTGRQGRIEHRHPYFELDIRQCDRCGQIWWTLDLQEPPEVYNAQPVTPFSPLVFLATVVGHPVKPLIERLIELTYQSEEHGHE